VRFAAPAVAVGLVVMVAGTAASATSIAGCRPGAGANLAGRHLTDTMITNFAPGHLRCANLDGANLAGLSLIQVDFTGASMRHANLRNADLTQAMLDHAVLTRANLSHARLGQVTATGANFAGANLSHADFGQADLTGANLSRANLTGASFTHATLDGVTWTGVTGIPPYSTYLLIAAVVIFALLVLGSIRQRLSGTPIRRRDYGSAKTIRGRGPVSLVRGLIGAFVAALGFHLFAGGLIGQVAGAFGPPVTQTCSGPPCVVGVGSGFVGLFVGVFVFLIGMGVRRAGSRFRQPSAAAGTWVSPADVGPYNPGGPYFQQGPGYLPPTQGGPSDASPPWTS
jgi:hypothetical protein